MTSTADEFLARLESIVTGKRGERIAPHKPLYLLFCIAALQKGLPRLQPFENVQRDLGAALKLFGQPKGGISPQYPFWRLQNDGLAEVVADGFLASRKSNSDPSVSTLLQERARGGFREEYYQLLINDESLCSYVIHRILDLYFPSEVHSDVIRFFDIRIGSMAFQGLPGWSSSFKDQVVATYAGRCAISGFAATWGDKPIGIDATPLFWPIAAEALNVSSAIALSSLCAKLYHLGFLSIDRDYRIMVSSQLRESGADDDGVQRLSGMTIRLPELTECHPNQSALERHRRWVFKR